MQYPVPQFTDVEDKIIGPLTIIQFGIIFGVGIIIFLGYSTTKSILVLIFLFVLFGVPALGVAFIPFNGRPIYKSFGTFSKFLTGPKVLIFHKEAQSLKSQAQLKDAQVASPVKQADQQPVQNTSDNLKQVQALLAKTASEEREVAGRMR